MSLLTLFNHYRGIASHISCLGTEITDEVLLAMKLLPTLSDLIANPQLQSKHHELQNLLYNNNLVEIGIVKAYIDEFEEMSYHETNIGKSWLRKGLLHRTAKDANGLTKPARIDTDGEMRWAQNGLLHREDKDEFGNLLPARTHRRFQIWYQHDKEHRVELGKNPNSGFYQKPLPAKILDGVNSWYYKGRQVSQSEMEKIIIRKTAKEEKRRAASFQEMGDVKKMTIILNDGSTITLGNIREIQLERIAFAADVPAAAKTTSAAGNLPAAE